MKTEFEFLTGNSVTALPENAIAFQVYLGHPMSSLASSCAQLGYQGLFSMHPYRSGNYSRNRVYPNLGFSEYLSQEDFGEDRDIIRRYTSNFAVNDMIIKKYKEAKQESDAPFLFYTMTMQNHGPYDKKYDTHQENCRDIRNIYRISASRFRH